MLFATTAFLFQVTQMAMYTIREARFDMAATSWLDNQMEAIKSATMNDDGSLDMYDGCLYNFDEVQGVFDIDTAASVAGVAISLSGTITATRTATATILGSVQHEYELTAVLNSFDARQAADVARTYSRPVFRQQSQ